MSKLLEVLRVPPATADADELPPPQDSELEEEANALLSVVSTRPVMGAPDLHRAG